MCLGVVLVYLTCLGTYLPISSSAHPRCTASPIERRVRCVKMPLLSFLAMSRKGGCSALSSHATSSASFQTCGETPTNAPTTKPDTSSKLHVKISVSASPVASAGVPSFAFDFLVPLWYKLRALGDWGRALCPYAPHAHGASDLSPRARIWLMSGVCPDLA